MSDLDKFIGDWNEARDAQMTLLKVELIAMKQSRDAIQADLTRITAWGRGLEHELRLAKEEIAALRESTQLSCWDGTEWKTRYQIGSQVI